MTKKKTPEELGKQLATMPALEVIEGLKKAILLAVETAKKTPNHCGSIACRDFLAAQGYGIVAPDGRVICIHRDARRGELFPDYEAARQSFKIAPQKSTKKRKARR